jgi:hypothetical protein
MTAFLGCVPAAVSAASPPPPITASDGRALVNCGFGDNVPMLPADFIPDVNAEPKTAGLPQAPDDVKQSLRAAFADAPPHFQNLLCHRLDGVFVTRGPQSWGYRRISPTPPHQRYVALALNLWTENAGHFIPIPLEDHLNKVFDALPPWAASPARPSYQAAAPFDPSRTILAVLAHEYGHVYWNDVVKDNLPFSFCDGLLNIAWSGNVVLRKWTNFGDTDLNDQTVGDPDELPQAGDPNDNKTKILALKTALTNHQYPLARGTIWRLLSRIRPFPSLLGAFSANEQFVETFEMYVLTQPGPGTHPLTSLPLRISANRTRDIPNDLTARLGRANLRAGMACMNMALPPQ